MNKKISKKYIVPIDPNMSPIAHLCWKCYRDQKIRVPAQFVCCYSLCEEHFCEQENIELIPDEIT